MLIPAMTYYDTETQTYVQQTIMQENGIPLATQMGFQAPEVKFKRMSSKAKIPTRSNFDDAGLDFYAAESATITSRFYGVDSQEESPLIDLSRTLISTDISLEIPQGLALFLWDRSGLSSRDGLHRVAGVIDSSFRGIIRVALVNLSNKTYSIKEGDKIIQGILMPIILPRLTEVNELTDTKRGVGGFGSTGK